MGTNKLVVPEVIVVELIATATHTCFNVEIHDGRTSADKMRPCGYKTFKSSKAILNCDCRENVNYYNAADPMIVCECSHVFS